LRAKFRGKPEHVVRFLEELAGEVRLLLAKLGLPSLAAAAGRTDLLEQVRYDSGLDLKPMLVAMADATASGAVTSWLGGRNDRPESHPPIDDAWVLPALEACEAGRPLHIETHVTNEDRTLGARIAGELALHRSQNPTAYPGEITFRFKGIAGQSFGAFAVSGMTLELEGLANDFVGKGLSGGELILRATGRAAADSAQHALLGNVALYGATGGSLYAAGRAGERFAVRNSGALAIVEGVGDHGCEYMTGGLAVVLGATGINFGAGMTGGEAWIYDEDGKFLANGLYHRGFLQPQTWDELSGEDRQSIHNHLKRHWEKTASRRAEALLRNWDREALKFVRLTPRTQA
jgi:glutamate synthase (NADPH/NADH) large chain